MFLSCFLKLKLRLGLRLLPYFSYYFHFPAARLVCNAAWTPKLHHIFHSLHLEKRAVQHARSSAIPFHMQFL
jgi:hypothetical protein